MSIHIYHNIIIEILSNILINLQIIKNKHIKNMIEVGLFEIGDEDRCSQMTKEK